MPGERLAACACGKVELSAIGAPILSCICYCDDCQAGGRQLEALGAQGFRDAWGGTPLLVYRDDRIACVKGAELLLGSKLKADSPTTRFIATCCKSAMYLKYGRGWWTSAYSARFQGDVPAPQMRSQTQHAADPAELPRDIPIYRSFPSILFAKLVKARVAMVFGV